MGGIPGPKTAATGPAGTSLSDALTVLRNMVQAINGAAQTYLNVQGAQNSSGISAATLVKVGAGRVAAISVTTAGTGMGTIYDSSSATAPLNPIYVIPEAVDRYEVNLPVGIGIVVVPGTDQVLAISYS